MRRWVERQFGPAGGEHFDCLGVATDRMQSDAVLQLHIGVERGEAARLLQQLEPALRVAEPQPAQSKQADWRRKARVGVAQLLQDRSRLGVGTGTVPLLAAGRRFGRTATFGGCSGICFDGHGRPLA